MDSNCQGSAWRTVFMNDRSLAISILQKARDALSERLTQRIIESRHDIEADAAGETYLSEIETLYDQLGGRLAHLNAMLSNLPPAAPTPAAEATASEIVYADLATGQTSAIDLDASAPLPMLGLPAPEPVPALPAPEPLVETFAKVVFCCDAGELEPAATLLAELLDIKPSLARRAARSFAQQCERYPELARRWEELGMSLAETNDYAAATLISDCFELQAIDSLAIVRGMKERLLDIDINE